MSQNYQRHQTTIKLSITAYNHDMMYSGVQFYNFTIFFSILLETDSSWKTPVPNSSNSIKTKAFQETCVSPSASPGKHSEMCQTDRHANGWARTDSR